MRPITIIILAAIGAFILGLGCATAENKLHRHKRVFPKVISSPHPEYPKDGAE